MSECATIIRTNIGHFFSKPVTDSWLAARMQIFFRFVVPSLKRQTVQPYAILLETDPSTLELLQPFEVHLQEAGVTTTATKDVAKFYQQLPSRYSHVTLVRLDSDDCYASAAIELVKEKEPQYSYMQFVTGYCWLVGSRRAGLWVSPSPPFYAVKFRRDDAGGLLDYNWPPHEKFKGMRDCVLPENQFLVLRHRSNRSKGDWADRQTRWKRAEFAVVQQRFQLEDVYWNRAQHPHICNYLSV